MANYANIKATIDANITQNGNEEITGPVLNSVLKDMVDSLASGYLYAGVASTSGTPGTPDENVYYIATTPGTYTNYGGLVVNDTEVALLRYNGSWSKVVTGIPSQTIVNLASRGFYIDRNHACSYSNGTGTYLTSGTNDCLWVLVTEDTDLVEVEGVTEAFRFFFSGPYPSSANYISYKSPSANNYYTLPSGTVLVCINLKHSDNTNGYASVKVNLKGATLSLASRGGVYMDLNHAWNINGSSSTYSVSYIYDTAWVRLLSGKGSLSVSGGTPYFYAYFSSPVPSYATLVDLKTVASNPTTAGVIPDGAVLCLIVFAKSANTGGYANLTVRQEQDYLPEESFETICGDYLRIVPTGKNYLNPDDFVHGLVYNNGKEYAHVNGLLSNKLYLVNGQQYTIQGIIHYGTTVKSYYGKYDADNNLISVGSMTVSDPDDTGYGTGSFTFWDNNGQVAYLRFCVQTNTSATFDASIAQIEAGGTATTVEAFTGVRKLVVTSGSSISPEPVAARRKVRILVVGNSYGQDAFAYVPYILPSLAEIDVEMGILYHASSTLQDQYEWFVNNDNAYTFYWCNGTGSWTSASNKSLRYGLGYQQWDIVVFHQFGWRQWTYSSYTYLNQLITALFPELKYPVKFGLYMPQSMPKLGETVYTDEQILTHYNETASCTQRAMNESLCDIMFPVGTAVQNARGTSLKNLGNYGNLTYEGVHLQEGLPCQLAAYSVSLTILKACGFADRSIYGDTNRADDDWLNGKDIPGPNGSPVGATDANARLAQLSAIMADKFPYQVTDVSNL